MMEQHFFHQLFPNALEVHSRMCARARRLLVYENGRTSVLWDAETARRFPEEETWNRIHAKIPHQKNTTRSSKKRDDGDDDDEC